MYYLAADVGGTKALLSLVTTSREKGFDLIHSQRFECKDYPSLEAIIEKFLSAKDLREHKITYAAFGLPGPVNSRVVDLTNLPWQVDADSVQHCFAIKRVDFINDFYAAAMGVEAIGYENLKKLYWPLELEFESNSHKPKKGNRLVVGAGTGLGVSPVVYANGLFYPQASEGGHFDFAPISQTQQVLLNWLWQKWQHVSYERLLSGAGIETLYEFFQVFDIPTTYELKNSNSVHKNYIFNKQNEQVGQLIAKFKYKTDSKPAPAPEITRLANMGDPIATKALLEFVTIYGAFIGATALIWNAPNGVYIAGGVAAKIMKWMQHPFFKQAYLEKGRMSPLLERMPVYVVTDEQLGLKGAAQYCYQNSK